MSKAKPPKPPPSFAALVQAYFAEHLTQHRALSAQTIAAHRDMSSLRVIERALGVPEKRFERPMFGYLTRDEMLAVIGTPDGTWIGQRDHVLFLMFYNAGARVSEITAVKVGDVVLDSGARPSRQSAPGYA
jgi:integrase